MSHTKVVGVVAYKRNAKSTNNGRTTQLAECDYDLLVCGSLHIRVILRVDIILSYLAPTFELIGRQIDRFPAAEKRRCLNANAWSRMIDAVADFLTVALQLWTWAIGYARLMEALFTHNGGHDNSQWPPAATLHVSRSIYHLIAPQIERNNYKHSFRWQTARRICAICRGVYSISTMEQMHRGKSRGKRFCRNLGEVH